MNNSFSGITTLELAINYVFITGYITIIVVEIPWIVYFIGKTIKTRRTVSNMEIKKDWSKSNTQIYNQQKNKLQLFIFLLISTMFESFTICSIVLTLVIIFDLITPAIDCTSYMFLFYFYIKYMMLSLTIVIPACTIELINLTTQFVNYIFLRNKSKASLKHKIYQFVFRVVFVAVLALSGIGLPLTFIFAEIFLIFSFYKYYKHSIELYKSLSMIAKEMLYEYGRGSIEAIQARNRLLHYKRFTIWFFTYTFILVLISIDFILWLPQSVIEDQCLIQNITHQSLQDLQFVNSDIYQGYKYLLEGVGSFFHIIGVIWFTPIYIIYSIYYLCEKSYSMKKYKYRYKIRYSVAFDDVKEMLI
ncbi:hypothetical protein LOD99_2901 [Oopsacas minuta]|uniref:Uncharacterized protein n=1 Tax=Oopsacas minuta TaxID=111878 RepID=A0AAV7K001_9METZ|nr:hypothetical protein LOD99_2901 [Oopsacas minuta]